MRMSNSLLRTAILFNTRTADRGEEMGSVVAWTRPMPHQELFASLPAAESTTTISFFLCFSGFNRQSSSAVVFTTARRQTLKFTSTVPLPAPMLRQSKPFLVPSLCHPCLYSCFLHSPRAWPANSRFELSKCNALHVRFRGISVGLIFAGVTSQASIDVYTQPHTITATCQRIPVD